MKTALLRCVAFLGLLCAAAPALAHFPWLAVADGKAIFYFGENPADRTYDLPPSIAKAQLQMIHAGGRPVEFPTEDVDSAELIGKISSGSMPSGATLLTQVTYGIYHGSRLDYYSVHRGKLPTRLDAYHQEMLPLQLNARLVDTESGIDVYVEWHGQPLAGVAVHLYCEEGHEEGNAKTDTAGKVSFSDQEVEDGLNGIMVGHTLEGAAGELDGETYASQSHYLTVTFFDPETPRQAAAQGPRAASGEPAAPSDSLHAGGTSGKAVSWSVAFGGRAKQGQILVLDGSLLYAFGGNSSREPHDFSQEAFVDESFVFDISGQSVERLPNMPRAVQSGTGVSYPETGEHRTIVLAGGLGMVGEEFGAIESILAFDLQAKMWESPAVSLPAPRSMFAAAVHDGALWMFGGSDAGRQSRGLASDVLRWRGDEATVTPLPGVVVPTPRRSFGGALLGGEYFLVGGLAAGNGLAESVDVFDCANRSWRHTAAPKVPRVFPSLAEAHGKLYLYGGFTRSDGHFAAAQSLEVYDPRLNTWTTAAAKLAAVDPSMSMVALQDRLLFYGVDEEVDGQANFVLMDTDRFADPGAE